MFIIITTSRRRHSPIPALNERSDLAGTLRLTLALGLDLQLHHQVALFVYGELQRLARALGIYASFP